jgi:FkbM family methyltransferase
VYDPEEIGILIHVLKTRRQTHGDGVVALDIGANIGVHTVCFARAMTGWGSVIAVEPQERVFYALAGNIALGNYFNARAIWVACGAWDSTIDMPELDYTRPASIGSLSLSGHNEDVGQAIDSHKTRNVRVSSIDSLKLPRCDFIKVDCEGAEVSVLRGAADTIARCRPSLFIETTKTPVEDVVRNLPDGYRVEPMSNGILVMPP